MKLTVVKNNYLNILLIVIPLLIYFPVLGHNFLYFWDDQWVVMNQYTQGGFNLRNLIAVFTDFYHGQYAPFNELSYLVLYQLVEYNPFWFHLFSMAWHIANVLLVFHFIQLLLHESNRVRKEMVTSISFFAALLFAVHPVNVESVAWISASKILVYSFFYLWTLIWYLKYLKKGNSSTYLMTLFFFCFSFFGKEQAVTLPLCLLLIDWFVKRKMNNKEVWLEKMPFFALSLIFGLITILSQEGGGNAPVYPFLQRMVLACYTVFEYLVKSIVPVKLSYIYPFPFQPGEDIPLHLWIYPVIILFLSYFVYLFRKNHLLVFSSLFFVIHLAVAIHIIPISRFAIVADRYAYLSIIGISLLAAYFFIVIFQRYKAKKHLQRFTGGILFVYLLYLGTYSHIYCRQWKDTDTLKKHIREVLEKRKSEEILSK